MTLREDPEYSKLASTHLFHKGCHGHFTPGVLFILPIDDNGIIFVIFYVMVYRWILSPILLVS